MRDVVTWLLVGAGLALAALSCLGVALMRDALDRLHYAGPASLAVACLCAAVLVRGGWSLIGLRAILLAAFALATSPVLIHATARTIQLRSEERR